MVFVLHLTAILLVSTMVFVIRVAVPYEVFGDRLNIFMRIIPSYSIAQALYFETSGDMMSDYRASTIGEGLDIDPNPWASENNTFDIKA